MGSFTSLSATQIMRAIFPEAITGTGAPGAGTGLIPFSATTVSPSAFRIYNGHVATAGQMGIYCGNTSNVIHTCHLVKGTSDASSNPSTSDAGGLGNLRDANFASASGAAAVGTISGSFATVGGTANYVTVGGGYVSYTGVSMRSAGGTTHSWTGWALTETSAKGQAVSAGQIGFPALGASSTAQDIYGFVICAQAAAADGVPTPNSTTTILASNTGGAPVIVAYGDLSTGRRLTTGDTPVFATGAITITLE